MAEAVLVRGPHTEQFTAVALRKSGEVFALPSTRMGVVAGLKDVAIGDVGEAHILGTFSMTSASATVISVGALVYWIVGTNLATGVATANKKLGRALKAKAAGDLTVLVALDPNA